MTLLERVSDHLPSMADGELRQRLWKVRAKQVVVATGANERTLVFGNNDLPGVMIQIRRALKPDGLFLGAILGGAQGPLLEEFLGAGEEVVPRDLARVDVGDQRALRLVGALDHLGDGGVGEGGEDVVAARRVGRAAREKRDLLFAQSALGEVGAPAVDRSLDLRLDRR